MSYIPGYGIPPRLGKGCGTVLKEEKHSHLGGVEIPAVIHASMASALKPCLHILTLA